MREENWHILQKQILEVSSLCQTVCHVVISSYGFPSSSAMANRFSLIIHSFFVPLALLSPIQHPLSLAARLHRSWVDVCDAQKLACAEFGFCCVIRCVCCAWVEYCGLGRGKRRVYTLHNEVLHTYSVIRYLIIVSPFSSEWVLNREETITRRKFRKDVRGIGETVDIGIFGPIH